MSKEIREVWISMDTMVEGYYGITTIVCMW